MTACFVIHYSAAVVTRLHSCTHVLFDMPCYRGVEPFRKYVFQDLEKRNPTLMHCNSVGRRSESKFRFAEFSIHPSIRIILKLLLLYSAVLHEI